MGERKLIQYINVQGWMLRDLGFSTNETLIYATIFSFSHDGKSEYRGGRHYLAKSLDISFSTLDRALDNLVNEGYIIRGQFDYKNMICNTYKVNLERVKQYLIGENYNHSQNEYPSQNEYGNHSQNDDYIIKDNNKKVEGKPSTPAKLDKSIKHPRNFSKTTLTDELNSLGELEEKELQRKEKQKSARKKTLYEKCIDEIANPIYDFSSDVQQRLKDFLPTTLQANEYPVKGINQWIYRLKSLIELSKDSNKQIEIIEYSIAHSITGFINPSKKNKVVHETKQDKIKIRDLEEAKAAMKKKDEEGVEIF